MTDQTAGGSDGSPYRVLARKYRPAGFDDLIGQEALVRTLTNAFQSGRIAHAFILTGVRGVGKTTTARIIARALNCIGAEGESGPTASPCGVCEHCQAIAADRHVDVIEMDAASRTGVGDIRELIDGVRYRPVQARYKVYIIDEVHMLSNSAFNALLKTLEEPPEHVIFIFATTEIRKVPVTVLSRCQRFDLRRVEQDVLAKHFAGIAGKEGITAAPDALAMIARAADGSVRDGLSLLDQAIVLANGQVDEALVRDMLGLADRGKVIDLFDAVMRGDMPATLGILADLYAAGADPVVVLQDLLELTHFLTRLKLVPATAEGRSELERTRGREMADKLSMAVLARAWQILLKGAGEAQVAPTPLQAAEMVLIRLAHSSQMPTPADLVKAVSQDKTAAPNGGGGAPSASAGASGEASSIGASAPASPPLQPASPVPSSAPQAALHAVPEPEPAPQTLPPAEVEEPAPGAPHPESLEEVVELAREKREVMLANYLLDDMHLVRFAPGNIEFRPGERAPAKLAGDLSKFLQSATGARWVVSVSREPGDPPLREQQKSREAERRAEVMTHPLVQAVLETFPGATLVDRRDKPTGTPQGPGADEGQDNSSENGEQPA